MKKFRLPRKEKKSLKRGFWLYPADEKGNSLMAHPKRTQKDYDAMKKGVLRNLSDPKRLKEGAKKLAAKIDPEIFIPDDQLKEYVDDIFRKDLRSGALRTFISAKNSETAVKAYFNFVNAYNLYKEGDDSYSNICCLTLDSAESLLRKENSTRRKRK
jgi:hypothetical protein